MDSFSQDFFISSYQKISETEGGFDGELYSDGIFGSDLAFLGDLDGDGIQDIAVGSYGDNDGGIQRGAVWIFFLNSDGTVKSYQKISSIEGGFDGILDDFDGFGRSISVLGDLDGDGIQDIAVGSSMDSDGGSARGAVWILFLNSDGTVKSYQKISSIEGGFLGQLSDSNLFGYSLSNMSLLDCDNIQDLAVGSLWDNDGGIQRGAVWILFLNSDGTVKSHQKISSIEGGFSGILDDLVNFGNSISVAGDLNEDGVRDIIVGQNGSKDNKGAFWVLFLNSDGTVKSHQKISSMEGGFNGILDDFDGFGKYLSILNDLNCDGIRDIAVSATGDDDGGNNKGAFWILFLNSNGMIKSHQKISNIEGGFNGPLDDNDRFGRSVIGIGDLDGNGVEDIVVSATGDDDGGDNKGALWILFLNRMSNSSDGPPTKPGTRPVLAAYVNPPSIDPDGGFVTYQYHWTSNGGDPQIIFGPTKSPFHFLYEGDGDSTFDEGETWSVTITPFDDEGEQGPSISGNYLLGINGSVYFQGWVVN